MLKNDRSFRMLQVLGTVVVAAGWLYMLAFTFHHWKERVLVSGLIIGGVTAGPLFERWRQRGDRLARIPFFVAAAAFAAAIIVASAALALRAAARDERGNPRAGSG